MKRAAMRTSAACFWRCDRMRAVSRPAVYIGFSYFGALLLATFLKNV